MLLLAVVFPAYLPKSALYMFETVVFLPPILFRWVDEQLLFWLFTLVWLANMSSELYLPSLL